MIRNKNLTLWLSEHKKEYNLILETCNNELSINKGKVDFEILVVRLITAHKVNIKYDLIKPLYWYIIRKKPKFVFRLPYTQKCKYKYVYQPIIKIK